MRVRITATGVMFFFMSILSLYITFRH
jgi:hypothetical protein